MKLICITGAGISKASNIPTFEELGDLRDSLTRENFTKRSASFISTVAKNA